MKKLISTIIALVLIVALLPTVALATTEHISTYSVGNPECDAWCEANGYIKEYNEETGYYHWIHPELLLERQEEQAKLNAARVKNASPWAHEAILKSDRLFGQFEDYQVNITRLQFIEMTMQWVEQELRDAKIYSQPQEYIRLPVIQGITIGVNTNAPESQGTGDLFAYSKDAYYLTVQYVTDQLNAGYSNFDVSYANGLDNDGIYLKAKTIDGGMADMRFGVAFDFTAERLTTAYFLGLTDAQNMNGTLTREQAATMAMRAANLVNQIKTNNAVDDVKTPISAPTASFSDYDQVSSWAKDGVNFVAAHHIMNGTGNNMFSPKGTYTVEQAIVTLYNIDMDVIIGG